MWDLIESLGKVEVDAVSAVPLVNGCSPGLQGLSQFMGCAGSARNETKLVV